MKYLLSKVVPMPFKSAYAADGMLVTVRWWQVADRSFAVKEEKVAL
jgi:hypothetical protein